MKLFKLEITRDIVERSGAADGSTAISPTVVTMEEGDKILLRPSLYDVEDARWEAAYGVQVPDEMRRFLIALGFYNSRNPGKTYAMASIFFRKGFRNYQISDRVLRDWRTKASELGYISVKESRIYFNRLQKHRLLMATAHEDDRQKLPE